VGETVEDINRQIEELRAKRAKIEQENAAAAARRTSSELEDARERLEAERRALAAVQAMSAPGSRAIETEEFELPEDFSPGTVRCLQRIVSLGGGWDKAKVQAFVEKIADVHPAQREHHLDEILRAFEAGAIEPEHFNAVAVLASADRLLGNDLPPPRAAVGYDDEAEVVDVRFDADGNEVEGAVVEEKPRGFVERVKKVFRKKKGGKRAPRGD
jgi:hypothetical protein